MGHFILGVSINIKCSSVYLERLTGGRMCVAVAAEKLHHRKKPTAGELTCRCPPEKGSLQYGQVWGRSLPAF